MLKPDDTKWLFEDDEREDVDGGANCGGVDGKTATKRPTYEEEERIAIQQEGCNKRIDIVLRYPIED